MFERAYALHSDRLTAITDDAITEAVSAYDSPQAQAAVACMTTGDGMIHFLIEYWRPNGDSQQETAGAVDGAATVGRGRRKGARQNNDAGTAAGVEPESVTLPLGTP